MHQGQCQFRSLGLKVRSFLHFPQNVANAKCMQRDMNLGNVKNIFCKVCGTLCMCQIMPIKKKR